MKKYLVGICVYNESVKITRVLEKFNNYDLYDVLVLDDGSTDGSLDGIEKRFPVRMIRNSVTGGAGHGVRQVFDYARANGYIAVFLVAGNDKDSPNDIEKLKRGMEDGCDVVQGSRYLPGGSQAKMPFYRRIATQILHPGLFSLITGRRMTDTTNGFRAVRMSMLDDERINLNQQWLDHYELEPYLLYKAIMLGYKVIEVPVTKIYPPRSEGYTKMKAITGWWSILRPLVYLGLRIKK